MDNEVGYQDPEDATAERDGVRVELIYIGECSSGEYRGNGDTPYMRFYVERWVVDEEEGWEDWVDVEDASYCTRLPAYALLQEMHIWAVEYILGRVEDDVRAGRSIKKLCEELSWIAPEWRNR